MQTIQRVGVLGAGEIGSGVGSCCAQKGLDVILYDHNPEQLQKAQVKIAEALRFQELLGGPPVEEPTSVLGRIQFSSQPDDLAPCHFLIENVSEPRYAKAQVYETLQAHNTQAVIAANTSAHPIIELSNLLEDPTRLVGIHFMNPVPLKDHVELIFSEVSSEQAKSQTHDFLYLLGKKSIEVGDQRGFVSNRILMLTVNEAIRTLQDQVAGAKSIDAIFERCMEYKMGPLRTADLIGLDTILFTLENLCNQANGERFEPSSLLRDMVRNGNLGRKSGKGFYSYDH